MAITDVSPMNDLSAALAPLAGWPEAARPTRFWLIKDLWDRFRSWQARRLTVRMLAALDGATLRDLGIADIESTVYGGSKDRIRGYDENWWRR